MREYQRLKGFTDNLELRRRNRATVEHYMRMKGAERLQRHSLFVEDGCAGNWTTESGEPLVFRGHESLRRLAEWLERCFPDWEWHNVRIFETEDPNHFWVECDGRGKALVPGYPEGYCENHYIHSFELENGRIKRKALVPGYPEGYCENHYIHSFELENGRIKRNREFMNPMQKLRALGIAVPQIKRDGIPT
ncbi:PhzA/PhzB family protein [Pseudomonas aeruginosa]